MTFSNLDMSNLDMSNPIVSNLTLPAIAPSWWVAGIVIVLAIRFRPTAPARSLWRESGGPTNVTPSSARQPFSGPHGGHRGSSRFALPAKRQSSEGELARWCDDVARSVRGGATLHASLRTVPAPRSSQIDRVLPDLLQQLARGRSLSEAIRVLPATPTDTRTGVDTPVNADVALILTVLEQCSTTGGSSAEPLERAASVLRARDAARGEVAAQSASARMSAIVLTLLPVSMLALLLATSATTRSAVTTPFGVAITVVGLALNWAGWRWMGRLINRAQS